MDGMPQSRSLMVTAATLSLLAGCASNRQSDLLEARLRQQEQVIANYERSLAEANDELHLARRDAQSLRTQMAKGDTQPRTPEAAESMLRAEAIQFNTLMTRGLDRDGQPGDEGITAVILPVDGDGELVKIPGTIEIEAHDLSQPEGQRAVGKWTFTPEQAREHWKRGFITSGYIIDLPWQEVPASSELVVHGRLITTDGRTFNANHTVKVDVAQLDINPGMKFSDTAKPKRSARVESIVEALSESNRKVTPVSFEDAEDSIGRAKLTDALPPPQRAPKDDAPPEKASGPRPFPAAAADDKPIRTSDSWTDETIPYVR